MKDKRRNELIQKTNELYNGGAIDDIDALRQNIKNLVNTKKNKKAIIEKFLKSVKIYEKIFEADGYLFLKPFLNKSNQNDISDLE